MILDGPKSVCTAIETFLPSTLPPVLSLNLLVFRAAAVTVVIKKKKVLSCITEVKINGKP